MFCTEQSKYLIIPLDSFVNGVTWYSGTDKLARESKDLYVVGIKMSRDVLKGKKAE